MFLPSLYEMDEEGHIADQYIDSDGNIHDGPGPDRKPVISARKALRAYNAWNIADPNLSATSVEHHARHMKVYMLFLHDEGLLPDEQNPYVGPRALKIPRAPKSNLSNEFYTEGECDAFHSYLVHAYCQAVDAGDDSAIAKTRLICHRDQLAWALMRETGIRSGELEGITIGQVDIGNYAIVHTQKGGTLMTTLFPKKIKCIVKEYLAILPLYGLHESTDPLFPFCNTQGFPRYVLDSEGEVILTRQPIAQNGFSQRFSTIADHAIHVYRTSTYKTCPSKRSQTNLVIKMYRR